MKTAEQRKAEIPGMGIAEPGYPIDGDCLTTHDGQAACIPNLDDIATPEDAEQYGDVFSALASYASHKAVAMRARLAGKIDMAMSLEAECDHIYRRLPDWARW